MCTHTLAIYDLQLGALGISPFSAIPGHSESVCMLQSHLSFQHSQWFMKVFEVEKLPSNSVCVCVCRSGKWSQDHPAGECLGSRVQSRERAKFLNGTQKRIKD